MTNQTTNSLMALESPNLNAYVSHKVVFAGDRLPVAVYGGVCLKRVEHDCIEFTNSGGESVHVPIAVLRGCLEEHELHSLTEANPGI